MPEGGQWYRRIPDDPSVDAPTRHGRAFANFCRNRGDYVYTDRYEHDGTMVMDVFVVRQGSVETESDRHDRYERTLETLRGELRDLEKDARKDDDKSSTLERTYRTLADRLDGVLNGADYQKLKWRESSC